MCCEGWRFLVVLPEEDVPDSDCHGICVCVCVWLEVQQSEQVECVCTAWQFGHEDVYVNLIDLHGSSTGKYFLLFPASKANLHNFWPATAATTNRKDKTPSPASVYVWPYPQTSVVPWNNSFLPGCPPVWWDISVWRANSMLSGGCLSIFRLTW